MWHKVLILDDNALDREQLRAALEEAGQEVEAVEDVPHLDKAIQWWKPDVTLVDVTCRQSALGELCQKLADAGLPTVLVGPRPQAVLDGLAKTHGAVGAWSTLEPADELSARLTALCPDATSAGSADDGDDDDSDDLFA